MDLLYCPRPVRVRGDPEDMHVAAADLYDEQAVQALQRGCAVHVEEIGGECRRGRFADRLVFPNACRTDGQAHLYTMVEGHAVRFLRAGAFIGSLWEAVDTSASTYAQEFYRAALTGRTLGEAARQARDAIRDNPGDPAWLAYTLCGAPAATLSTAPGQDRLDAP